MDRALNLFTIDVEAEIRKLSGRRYTAVWEPFVELIRLAAGFRPERIDVEMSKHRFLLRAPGAVPDEAVFLPLLSIFDEGVPPERRHRALSELEAAFGLGILAAFAGNPRRVDLAWRLDGRARGIAFSPGKRPGPYAPRRPADFRIDISGSGSGRAGQQIIGSRCRYAAIPIAVNGTRVSFGRRLERCLLSTVVNSSVISGVAGIPESGDVTQITRLRHGIVDEETVFPAVRGLVTAAVVEDAMEDIHAVNGALREVGRGLYHRLAASSPNLGPGERRRAEALLFDRFEHTRDGSLLAGVKAFKLWKGDSLDFFEVKRRLHRGPLFAIDADAPAILYELEERAVLVLDKRARRFLESALDIPLMEPPRRAYFRSLRERLTSWARHLKRGARGWLQPPGPPIPDEDLAPDDRRFLQALRAAIQSGALSIPGDTGAGAVTISMSEKGTLPWTRLNGRGRGLEYRIPRSHRWVRAMVRAFASNPAYLYPALALLAEGREVAARRFSPFDRRV